MTCFPHPLLLLIRDRSALWARAVSASTFGISTAVHQGRIQCLTPGVTVQLLLCVIVRAQDGTLVGESIRELLSLSKKLAAVRGPPRVVVVQGANRSGAPAQADDALSAHNAGSEDSFFSASAAWQEQQVVNARLEREWRESHGRAAKALTTLLGGGELLQGALSA